ncbi:hypothetical protein C0214_19375 [Methylobacterium sp. DM1]|nr:hypothetical protein C0214_19375 [Methylobacterium sp. DM1]
MKTIGQGIVEALDEAGDQHGYGIVADALNQVSGPVAVRRPDRLDPRRPRGGGTRPEPHPD